MRIDPLDDLAVQLHHQPQHAVRRRMLRSEIDRVILDLDVADARIGRRHLLLQLLQRRIAVRNVDMVHQRFTSSAFSGVGAPLASGTFSSPGSTYSAPSHGLVKSKLRKSCASRTGS